MFNFVTTTIINSDKDIQSGKALFSSIAKEEGKHDAILKIKRDFTFEKKHIVKVFKKVANEPVKGEITIDCTALLSAIPVTAIYPVIGRISLYVALEGSEESIFANDFMQKGHPFSVGFKLNNAQVTASEVAAQIKKSINRFAIGNIGRNVFTADAKQAVVTLKATEEYSRFKGIVILLDSGDEETELAHLFDGETDNTQKVITVVHRGKNGFGTFSHIVKDLRLPTAVNTSWTALRLEERPVPGALYDQYLIYYKAPSGTNPSLVAVGHKTDSETVHSFWVRQDFSKAFETVITEVVGSAPVAKDRTAVFEEVKDSDATTSSPGGEDSTGSTDHNP